MKKQFKKNILLFISGFILTVIGIALSLLFWPQIVLIFRGTIGPVVAVAGLYLLYLIRN